MKDRLNVMLDDSVTNAKTIPVIREMLEDVRSPDELKLLEGAIKDVLLNGTKFSRQEAKTWAKRVMECMCAGAFGTMVPDHAVSVVDSGPGGAIKSGKKKLYDYADPKDFLHESIERMVDVVPYQVDFEFLAFSDGRFLDRVEAPGLLARLRAATPKYPTVYIDVEDGPEDFRFSVKTVHPVLTDDNSHVRLGKDERMSLRQKDYRASLPSYEYFAVSSFIFDSREEARAYGWGV